MARTPARQSVEPHSVIASIHAGESGDGPCANSVVANRSPGFLRDSSSCWKLFSNGIAELHNRYAGETATEGTSANDSGCGLRRYGNRLRLNLVLRHDGGSRTGLFLLVDLAIDDLYALQILLYDLLACDLDILIGVLARAFMDTVDHMFLHQNPNLFG